MIAATGKPLTRSRGMISPPPRRWRQQLYKKPPRLWKGGAILRVPQFQSQFGPADQLDQLLRRAGQSPRRLRERSRFAPVPHPRRAYLLALGEYFSFTPGR